jgi:hypothetical protein
MTSANQTYPSPSFDCGECGQRVGARDKHDYTDCITYRWSIAARSNNDTENLSRAEKDIRSLISRVRDLERQLAAAPHPRG